MPISPHDGEKYAREIRRTYAQAERDTIRMLADTLGSDTYREDWAQLKLRQLREVRGKISSEVIDNLDVDDKVRDAVEQAYRDGSDAGIADLRKLKRKGADIGDVTTSFGKMNYNAISALARDATGNLKSTHMRILRQADDVYRRSVNEATRSVLAGTATRREASQKVLNKFANQGVTGFVDNAGRHWNMASYSEMAVRTATGRAAVQGHLDRMQQNGRDLVIVSDHAEECPLCRPWEGRILSINGKNSKYPSVDDARSGGLWHPNCRHTVHAYISGLTEKPTKTADPGGNELRRQQRYNERNIRKWKRRKAGAMDEAEEEYAQRKISQWQAKQRELIDSNDDLKRLYYRESITEKGRNVKTTFGRPPHKLAGPTTIDDEKEWLYQNFSHMDISDKSSMFNIDDSLDDADVLTALQNYSDEMYRLGQKYSNVSGRVRLREITAVPDIEDHPLWMASYTDRTIRRLKLEVGEQWDDAVEGMLKQHKRWNGPGPPVPKIHNASMRWNSNADEIFKGVARHETGHHYYMTSRKVKEGWDNVIDDVADRYAKGGFEYSYKDLDDLIEHRVSEYANTDKNEMFAEAFSMYTDPNYGGDHPKQRLPKEMANFMEKVLTGGL